MPLQKGRVIGDDEIDDNPTYFEVDVPRTNFVPTASRARSFQQTTTSVQLFCTQNSYYQ